MLLFFPVEAAHKLQPASPEKEREEQTQINLFTYHPAPLAQPYQLVIFLSCSPERLINRAHPIHSFK